MKSGSLIVFEGLDGCGKSTQARLLAEALEKRSVEVLLTREPTDGEYGQKIRRMAKSGEKVTPEEELSWFMEDRREHLRELVLPALEAGKTVISDRYYFSTVAYQGARGLDSKKILQESQREFRDPDLVFLVNLPVEEGLRRVGDRGEGLEPAFEEAGFLNKVATLFDAMDFPCLVRINGSRSVEEIHREILQRTFDFLDRDDPSAV